MQPSRPEWEMNVNFVTKVILFQNVQEAQRRRTPSMPALSQDINSPPARHNAMVSVQCRPELLCQGRGHIVQTLTQKSWIWDSNGCSLKQRKWIFFGNLQGSIVLRGHAQSAEGNFYGCLSGCSVQTHVAVKCKLESLTLSLFGNVSY